MELRINRVRIKRSRPVMALLPISYSSVFPYICRYLHYLHHMMLVNVELDVSDFERLAVKCTCFGRLITTRQRSCGKLMLSILSVCLSDHYPWCIGLHHTGTSPSALVPLLYSYLPLPAKIRDMFKFVHLRTSTPPLPVMIDIWWQVRWESGRYATYWNAFLF